MRHDINLQRIDLHVAALKPFVEVWPTRVQGACPYLGRFGEMIQRLRIAIRETLLMRRTEAQLATLDERMLKDIGLTRAEASGWGPLGDRMRSHDHGRQYG
ncbi:DUF1127 domain-containing protein [Bosea caraganae]|uniref:DUF1127 domain-containing protein n=1 Tax=Bosea caraganae TaxID=2763117 RepID=A0A370L9W9_9HYPH|nr:DUF1127 domain-containing protein [Bosea caraganae]RDJ21862.1 DUF1127 domain-containing protein [Bosea caraganae]RDJ28107.1 DUF1127 domain-containing protein [Bosea caraganae]